MKCSPGLDSHHQCLLRIHWGVADYWMDSLKAAGTPTIKPFPVNCFERLTLLPGEPSTSSTSGSRSPVLTMMLGVDWKDLVKDRADKLMLWERTRRVASMFVR